VHTDSADRLHIIFVALCVQTIHKNQIIVMGVRLCGREGQRGGWGSS
jgi:hypothetical protein